MLRSWYFVLMRYLVLSDIHANLEALEAVLKAALPRACDRVLVLGDLVGYGADPNAVVERVRGLQPEVVIRGNHDKVASGVEDPEGFNAVARGAARWTCEALTADNRAYLASLPSGPHIVDDLVEICHGAPFDEDAYVFDELDAIRALRVSRRSACLFGHTHLPIVFYLSAHGLEVAHRAGETEVVLPLAPEVKYLINPGSVGQPRDGDWRAAYAVVDASARTLMMYRVEYEVEAAQAKVMRAGLPDVLARRLGVGR